MARREFTSNVPTHHMPFTPTAYRRSREMSMHDLDHALTRIEMDYREMPDLKLTYWQARRLWNLDDEVCEQALARLVASKFLHRTPDGGYIRRSGGSVRLAS
jgi:hypothetical protein